MISFQRLTVMALLAFILCLSTAGQAEAQNCPRHKTQMILKPELTKTKFMRGSAAKLTQWTTGHTQNVGGVLGLGGGEIGTRFEAAFKYSTTPDGLVCVQLDKVRAIFYAHPRMYVASDYKKGTCEYEEIVKHEKRHIKAMIDFFDSHIGRFETHLGRIAKTIPLYGPVPDAQVPDVKQQLMDHVILEYSKYANNQLMSLQRQQQKIDSPNEYRGVASRCDNW